MSSGTPIAVVGMSCLLPGASTPEEFWASLREGADQRSHGGREVFGTDPSVPGGWGDDQHSITTTRGGFVGEVETDLEGLGLPAEELDGLGRVVRWPLHTARRALADAGLPESGEGLARTGLVLGNYSFPTEESTRFVLPMLRAQVSDGLRRAGLPLPDDASPRPDADPRSVWASGLPACVVHTALGLGGPHLALDAACSSTLYGIALARDYLLTGAADVMLAGAVCAPDPLLIQLSFSDLRALPSDDDVSQPFDARSSGIVTGQGAGAFVLKRLPDALADGDRVHAVVESIGLGNDGAGRHVLSPDAAGQLDAYRAAYADVDPATVDYVECHATGTPLGDSTELRSLSEFFDGRGSAPLLGSVKGNVGHLLTAAGLTSMLKVIMAMREGRIPATPGVGEALSPSGGEAAARRVVLEERAWPETAGRPRRAGVSAFGFGGTNAHLVLSSEPGPEPSRHAPSRRVPRMAVTGVGARLGPLETTAPLQRKVRRAESGLRERPAGRWYGADDIAEPPGELGESGYAEQLKVDLSTYRIPPFELNQANPQHLMMFEAADAALADAGFDQPEETSGAERRPARRVAVVVAMEMEPHTHTHRARFDIGAHVRAECARAGVELGGEVLKRLERSVRDAVHEPIGANEVLSYIGNIMSSRISASRNLVGPSFTISADRTAGARAVEIAGLLLLDESIEAVVVGGVDLACGPANVNARARLADERGEELPPLGDGAAAVVLTRAGQVGPEGQEYATVDSVSLRPDPGSAAREALRAAGSDASEVDYLELGSATSDGLATEVAELAGAYRADDLSCAVGGLAPLVGDTQAGCAVASLVKVALCLDGAELPATPAEPPLAGPELAESAFYRVDEPRPWLRRHRDGRRIAALSAVGSGTAAHLVLSSGQVATGDAVRTAHVAGPLVLALSADDAEGIAEQAARCAAELDSGGDALALCWEHAHGAQSARLTAVLVSDSGDGLREELRSAERDLPAAVADGEWSTPAGSFCTGRPLGPQGRVALVYPGAFTTYPGAGREMFRLFPELLADFEAECEHPAERFKHRELYPRAREPLDRRTLLRHEAELLDDIPVMLATGTNFAVLATRMLRDVLGVRPDGGFGYSLGESSMLFATGVWSAQARDDTALAASPLFRDELRGPKRQVRRSWDLAPETADSAVWSTHVLLADPETVRGHMRELDRVFLTHVNTPEEVVVAGDPGQCRALVERVGCQAAKAPANHVMHVPLVDPHLDALAALNDYPLGDPDPGLELLSAYDYEPVDFADRGRIAERIARTLRGPIDFARLARTAHERGFRYFVEVGPGSTCTRWIDDTLDGREHVAVSLDRRGAPAGASLARAVARLVSHGMRVDLTRLLGMPDSTAQAPTTHVVPCGGESVVERVREAAEPVLHAAVQAEDRDAGPADDEAITIEREPFVHLTTVTHAVPTQRGAPPARQHGQRSSPPEQRRAPGPVQAIAATVGRAHRSALRTQAALQECALRELERTEPDASGNGSAHGTEPPAADPGGPADPPSGGPTGGRPGVVWGESDLLEFAQGRISEVFGPSYAEIDSYPVRVRLPAPPYLFVSRVTDLDARPGQYEPSSLTTEYDVPDDPWYAVDGLVPCAVTIEAGQCDMLLISYLGIDFRNRGERVYRLLDSSLVFHGDLPRRGQTLRYEIGIDRFVSTGDRLLFFFDYRCYADGELILELLEASAGFFSREELDESLGIVETDADRRRREAMTPSDFKPLARTGRTSLTAADLRLLAQGRPGEVFGPSWDQSADGFNPSLRLPGDALRMIDEMPRIERQGGPRELGDLAAVKHLDPDGWYFECHFPGDPVLAGSLVAEGGVQILQVYAMYLGLHLVLPDAEFQSVPGLRTEVKVRGQITPQTPRIDYHVEITEITMLPRPTVIADITVYDGDKPIVAMRDFGVQVREKPGTPYRPGAGGVPEVRPRRNESGEAAFINELHLAHAAKGHLGTAMGPEFDVYDDRRAPHIPNGDFRFVDRIMRLDGTRGRLEPGVSMATEYDCPPEAWFHREAAVEDIPNCVYMETSLQAAILLGYYLGATLEHPHQELSIRNLDGNAELVKRVDLRGRTIRHETTMLSSGTATGAILQRFRYELSADGEVFYRGESLFGYFTEQALANQVGLDSGSHVAPWLDRQTDIDPARVRTVPVRSDERWFTPRDGLRLSGGHLRLVDEVDLVEDGGEHGRGYLRGRREIDPHEWYFDCHFHRDPVMPGSLGVEAVIQALHLYVLETGLAGHLGEATFATPVDERMEWKYRGQILRTDGEMTFDAHITDVRVDDDRVVVVADANVWKPGLRIYELTGVAVQARRVS
ncbi:PfaB family protein [Saccharopolyspora erythraea NRRL 2338]|uniref:Beta-ketoacyl synthase n=1 Tax=Saccharopolyspora erythraea (strain ATCC 11635 / DSM 40517 / JCM 4748 / NBRC 13426 / NCIMB 8594 / NRRL 2338) TaxID=405948 RepID=A4F5Q2_SACEN|nr:beta-ketoacyl synthase N-terminal-like domain-containing protein [Saccharopolyspora erythraea]PFG93176.1 PfaB family protein [Saccharopolyspora erythraea NRRL 2338]CAL99376.1 beta-ketoacyl synthase [Saccharopolyspora erythraea NRRL 2338]